MSFIASVFSWIVQAVVDIVVFIVEAVISIVELVIHLIMVLLGWDGSSDQIVEYFEVYNVPLFDDVDRKNPLLNSIIRSILSNTDLASNLIYHSAFRSLKGNIKDFMQFIENGNYFEDFPTIESYILTIDYTELTAALNTLNGVPCTPEGSYLTALSIPSWVKYWLQENKEYNVGANTMEVYYSTTSTSPITPAADTVTVTASTNHFDIAITSEITSSDTVKAISSIIGSQEVQVNLSTVVYNSGADTYTVQVYNAAGLVLTLPYTVPTKPTQLHYVSYYYRDSAPSRQYLFIYRVGTGTYTDLDTVETPIDQDGATIKALPAIPLRISNSNYTTFGTTKKTQIEDLLAIIHLDAEEMIDLIMNDPGAEPGDIDNVYINFGVRMWDTSQAGMSYLYTMFENIYPTQGITQGTYNNSPAGDTKPQNNILTTTDDNMLAFQWSYITYEHTSLADINADSGSVENGIYYSDMSKFGSDNLLKYIYFVSSGKGTYNVGYKADNLTEVAAFLAGSGVVNPGTTTAEATNWLQVTERMTYNNTTPVLLDPDNTTSDLIYLTPDLVYENNGSGTLRLLEQASEATTVGQSITYYCCKPSGLDAYTVVAPIAALKVIDGDSGHFRMVKFNLGNKKDLMAPFIHTFIKDLSNQKVSQLFLAGAHASIYIAHYEVIHHAGMSFFTALVAIIIIIVIIYITWGQGTEFVVTLTEELVAAAAVGGVLGVVAVIINALATLAFKFVVQMIIQKIIIELVDDPELALILNLLVAVGMTQWQPTVSYGQAPPGTVVPNTYGPAGGMTGGSIEFMSAPNQFHFINMTRYKSFSSLTLVEFASLANMALDGMGTMQAVALNTLAQEISSENSIWDKERRRRLDEIREWEEFMDVGKGMDIAAFVAQGWKVKQGVVDAATILDVGVNNRYETYFAIFNFDRIDINDAGYIN